MINSPLDFALDWRRTENERSGFYSGFAAVVRRLFRDESRRTVIAVRNTTPSYLAFAAMDAVGAGVVGLRAAFLDMLRRVVDHFYRRQFSHLGLEPPAESASDYPDVFAWIDENAARKSELINETSKVEIREVLKRGAEAGAGVEEMARLIERHYATRGRERARIISREVVVASSYGALQAAKKSGVVSTKTLLSTDDPRVRPTHAAANGQTVGIDEDFNIGGFPAQYPGDVRLPAHESIQCRCTILFGLGENLV